MLVLSALSTRIMPARNITISYVNNYRAMQTAIRLAPAAPHTHFLFPCQAGALMLTVYIKRGKGKSKAVPLQACSGPEGSRKFKAPRFHDNGTGWR